jgi:hypothetical protein
LPPQILDYSDYHRTVIGYHGTDVTAADRLVAGEAFEPSDQDDEWFGKGIYFWEHAFKQAWWWARDHKKHDRPAVVGAVIRLGYCFDLLDPGNVAVLREYLHQMLADLAANGIKPPQNVRTHRKLDCALFNHLYDDFEESKRPLDTARAVYVPTSAKKRICKGSWISEETHIQVCVRNPRSILAVWHVREDGRYGKAVHPGGGPQ